MEHRKLFDSEPGDWFYLAADRLRAADPNWQGEGLTPSGIELLQESVERFLKGYLVSCGWKLVKTHDLQRLLADAEAYDARFAQFEDLAENLTQDFFAQHYPGSDLTEVGKNYPQLRQQTGDLLALIKELLPQHFSS